MFQHCFQYFACLTSKDPDEMQSLVALLQGLHLDELYRAKPEARVQKICEQLVQRLLLLPAVAGSPALLTEKLILGRKPTKSKSPLSIYPLLSITRPTGKSAPPEASTPIQEPPPGPRIVGGKNSSPSQHLLEAPTTKKAEGGRPRRCTAASPPEASAKTSTAKSSPVAGAPRTKKEEGRRATAKAAKGSRPSQRPATQNQPRPHTRAAAKTSAAKALRSSPVAEAPTAKKERSLPHAYHSCPGRSPSTITVNYHRQLSPSTITVNCHPHCHPRSVTMSTYRSLSLFVFHPR
jgi:hypothetical protein